MSSSSSSSIRTASLSTPGPARSAKKDLSLADYFWQRTLVAMANDLPAPRLEFYFDGLRAFALQAELEADSDNDDTNGGDDCARDEPSPQFLLLDYEDYQPFAPVDAAAAAASSSPPSPPSPPLVPSSKRGLTLVVEDDDAVFEQRVFALELDGTRACVDDAIDRVAEWFGRVDDWVEHAVIETVGNRHALDAVVTRPVLTYDSFTHETDRRYSDVQTLRGETRHCPYHKSDAVLRYETAGDVALSFLRVAVLHFRTRHLHKKAKEQRQQRQQQEQATADKRSATTPE